MPLIDLPTLGSVEEDALVRFCWTTGALLEERYDALQLEFDTMFAGMAPRTRAFLLESRKIGKTLGLLMYADKFARQRPGSIIRFAFPTKIQGKTIILPLMDEMQADCPADLRWVNHEAAEGCWILPHNGSKIYLAGTDTADQVDRLRGPRSDLIILDEVPTFNEKTLMYLINSVLWPQTLNTGGLMIMSGTPPSSLDHPSVDLIEMARRNNTLYTKTIFDNPRLSDEVIRTICEQANPTALPEEIDLILAGKLEGTPEWEREFMCRMVADKNMRVSPKFNALKHVRPIPSGTPSMKFVFIDAGHVRDHFAAEFCELDYINQLLLCRDEVICIRKSTREIQEMLEKKEDELWPHDRPSRYLDQSEAQQIYDFTEAGYIVHAAIKSPGKGQLVVDMNNLIKVDRMIVDPKCKVLVGCLTNGLWADTAKEDFRRSPSLGHLDALDAVAQGCMILRQRAKWQQDPTPKTDYDRRQHFIHGIAHGDVPRKPHGLAAAFRTVITPIRRLS